MILLISASLAAGIIDMSYWYQVVWVIFEIGFQFMLRLAWTMTLLSVFPH
jgi:hypothetical protein